MSRDELRASDDDRQRVVEQLQQSLAEGRFDLHEFDDRVRGAYGAETYKDLKAIVADLPQAVPIPIADPGVAPAFRNATRLWLWHQWEGYIRVVALVVAIYLVIAMGTGDLGYFWPIWVAGPWGLVLIGQTVSGLARGEPQRWLSKKERKRQKKIAKRAREADALDGNPRPLSLESPPTTIDPDDTGGHGPESVRR
jgi:hypothetical protein